ILSGMQAEVIRDAAPWGLPLELKIMPQHFKDLGYQVNMIGKWHLGFFQTPYTPPKRGFDSFFGYYTGENDYYNHTAGTLNRPPLYGTFKTKQTRCVLAKYSTHTWGLLEAFPLLLNLHSQPFFCYFSYQAVHAALMNVPFQAPERNVLKFPYIGETNRTLYAGMLDSLDESIGRVVEILGNAGMLEDTIIAFSSDNGGLPYNAFSNRGFNWPLRGAKGTLWEGGVRVPAFVWSSKFLKKPRVSDQLMHISDWLPTLYSAAGGDVSNLGSLDGVNMWRYLTLGLGSARKEVLLTIDPMYNLAGLRYKNYKLVVGEGFDEELDDRYAFPGGLRPTNDVPQLRKDSKVARVLKTFYGKQNRNWSPLDWSKNPSVDCRERWLTNNFVARRPPYLFNLARDPCELNNLAGSKRIILHFMMHKLAAYNATAVPPRFLPEDPRGYPEYHGGVWSPWLD
ncbi:arylsulfatase B, putative, partial [Ixodes scapularis]